MGGEQNRKTQKVSESTENLNTIDSWIDDRKLKKIAAKGQKVIPELEAILHLALQQSSSNKSKILRNHVSWFSVVHAIFLLAHLRSEQSLDLILEFFAQKQEILDYWLPDIVTDDFWEVIYYLGPNQLEKLERFILNPENNAFSRLALVTALIQIGLHKPSKKKEVVRIFKRVLDLKGEKADFIGLIASELLDLKEADLQADIIRAIEQNEVWSGIIAVDEVNWCYKSKHKRKLNPLDLFERMRLFRQYPYFAKSTSTKTPLKAKRRNLQNLL